MMEVAILILALILIVALISLSIRRKRKKELERLIQKKEEIQQRPISEELAKVKDLNMHGQAEELFERWRAEWTEMVDVHIPAIDTLLLEAEEAIDKMRFSKARGIEQEIEDYIEQCNNDMNKILAELDHLIGSDAKSRVEIEQLKEQYRTARKTLLAHQHAYGPALPALEQRLEIFAPSFEEYDTLTIEGNYLKAREMVESLVDEAKLLHGMITDIPNVLTEVHTKIPGIIHELRSGHREMEQTGYYLAHLEMMAFLDDLEMHLQQIVVDVQQLELEKVRPSLQLINEELDVCYDQLEQEVVARRFVEQHAFSLKEKMLHHLIESKDLITEAIFVQQSYRLSEDEADTPKQNAKDLENLQRRYDVVLELYTNEQSAFSSLEEELKAITAELETTIQQQQQFAESLKKLRLDETQAHTELEQLRKELHVLERKLHKANIPGIPDEMRSRMSEVDEQLFIVAKHLEEVPLHIHNIESSLKLADKLLRETEQKAKEMLENVVLFEHTVRYGNRYRASNPAVNQRFKQAEKAFAELRYSKALEQAGLAVSEIDPKAFEVIERAAQEDLQKIVKL